LTAQENPAGSADGVWRRAETGQGAERPAVSSGAYFHLDANRMNAVIGSAPLESETRPEDSSTIVHLPLPTGGFARFRVVESNLLEPALAARFPEIKSYSGQGIDDPAATARFGWSPSGLSGLILGRDYSVSLAPQDIQDPGLHRAAFRAGSSDFTCGVKDAAVALPRRPAEARTAKTSVGSQLRIFRAAIATTQAYLGDAQLGNGSLSTAVGSINGWLNGVNAFYERELSVRLTLVNNTSIIGLTPAQIDNASESNALGAIPALLGTLVGNANFDIGHVLITGGGGGVAYLAAVCNGHNAAAPTKGGGVSSVVGPAGDISSLEVLIHEIGHQFGAPHTFNGTQGGCAGNRSASFAVETGSGITIMSYGGGCGTDNIGSYDKSRFHNGSFTAMEAHLAGQTCGTTSATGNAPPTVSGGPDRTIPKGTPFALTATAADPDAADFSKLTYNWEQVDAGGASFPQNGTAASFTDAADPANTTRPTFRAFASTPNPTRTLPRLPFILNNANVPPTMTGSDFTAESLPAIGRTLNFRVTVRDSRASGGGVADDQVTLAVDANSGPFAVTAPNTGSVSWTTGGTASVTWSVAGTATAPVSATNVLIRLSVDGGSTFPYLLAGPTPNDGSESVTVPVGLNTAMARVKVEASGNIFFDISDANFSINGGTGCPAVSGMLSSTGAVGSTVLLDGVGFTSVTGVSFSGSGAATFTVVSDARISLFVPAGATSGPLTLSKTGCAATATPAFTVCASSQSGSLDDNSADHAFSGPTHFVNRITPTSYPATLTAVTLVFDPLWSPPAAGKAFTILSAANPSGGTNINALPYQTTLTTLGAHGAAVSYPVPAITITAGDFIVGFSITTAGGEFIPTDTASPKIRSYTGGSLTSFATISDGNLMIRATYATACTAPTCVTVSTLNPGSGGPGTPVTLTGSGFAGVSSVRFGGNASAKFTIVSDTEVTTVVPPGAATGTIALTRTGCAEAQSGNFVVDAIACPVVTGINPTSAAPGSSVTLSGSGLLGLDIVKFSVDTGSAFSVSSSTQALLIVPSGTAPGPITVSKSACANAQSGTFLPCDTPIALAIDDGRAEDATGGPVFWANRLTPPSYPATLTGVTIQVNATAGRAFSVLAAANPTGGTSVAGLTFQTTATTTGTNGAFNTYAITPISITSGDFVVGFTIDPAGTSVPRDTTAPQANRSYVAYGGTSEFTAETGANFLIRGTYSLACGAGGATVPGAPAISSVTGGNGTVSVAFTAPASNGGSTITGYTATCGSKSATGASSPITVTGLTNGTAVTCTATATNAIGNSVPSSASSSVTPGFSGIAIPRLVNISTRGLVGTGDNIMIGGFIIGGSAAKKVVIRGRGPSMATLGVPGTLANPAIRLFNGATPIEFNDNWQTAPNATEITVSGQAPSDTREAALLTTVNPGVPYTVHLTGVGETSGIAIVEVFELDKPEVPLLNISTRGPVLTGDQVMIGGFIIQGEAAQQVLVLAKGPSLGSSPFNVPGALPDPTLDLYQAGIAEPIESNDNWVNSPNMAAIQSSGNAPSSPLESGIIRTLAPGAYTAIVRGAGAFQGIGLVEVYKK